MREARRTPVPLPGPIVKQHTAIASKKNPLSNEYVDSDEASDNGNAPKPKSLKTPRTRIAVQAQSDKILVTSKRAVENSANLHLASRSQTSTELPAAKQSVEVPTRANKPSSRHSRDTTPAQSILQAKKVEEAADVDSHSQAASDDDLESPNDSFDEEIAASYDTQPAELAGRSSHTGSHIVNFHTLPPYMTPRGFLAVPIGENPKQKSTRVFEKLDGKQVWHITAPTGVSLQNLNELVMEQVSRGGAVFEHKNTPYTLTRCETSDASTRQVLMPHLHGYTLGGISQSFRLQAVAPTSALDAQQVAHNAPFEAIASITRSTIRAPRQRVKGLRMRFLPIGFHGDDAGLLGSSDSEQETQRAGATASTTSRIQFTKKDYAEVSSGGNDSIGLTKHKRHRLHSEKLSKENKRARMAQRRAQEVAKPVGK